MAERERNKQRNLNIDLMKFLYSWCIVFYHFYSSTGLHFVSGYYAVEFYLLAAGIFFFQAWERSENESPPRKNIFTSALCGFCPGPRRRLYLHLL